ncbi:hypothetical protein K4H28_15785 [Deefgea tanakiae]|uniref:histidine kinase n=1 Tax=Deefgea tanakiae TaxID=2865840 RepID=A0ABX8Z553_9NEIS|nr:ATP-binding protein [Deefgea tanakiae]QZA77707.1 hypothetical protein K4H28_15785 [Deefgea tanakiae]
MSSSSSSSLLQLRRLQRNFVLFLLSIAIPIMSVLWLYKKHTEAASQERIFAEVMAHTQQQQLAFTQVIQIATSHLQRLSVQLIDAYSNPDMALNDSHWKSLNELGVRRQGSGELTGSKLDAADRDRYGALFVSPKAEGHSQLDKEITATMAIFPAIKAAHKAYPFFQWTYYYSPREDFSSLYPYVPEADILQATGSNTMEEALKVIFDAGGTKPVQMIGPNRNPQHQQQWTAPYYDAGGKGAMVSLLAPQYFNKEFVGVLGTDVTLRMFGEVLQGSARHLGHALVVDRSGNVIADDVGLVQSNKDILKLEKVLPSELAQLLLARHTMEKNKIHQVGNWYWMSVPLKGSEWDLLVYFSAQELGLLADQEAKNTLWILLGLIGFLVLATWLMSHHFAFPALRLVDFLNKLIGNPAQPIPTVPKAWQPSFEQVAATSQERHAYLQTIEAQADGLEKTVAQRTEQLSHANTALLESIEQLKSTQKMLVESEKMAALGALVAGVAHELNTPIGVGVTISSTLLEKNQELVLQLEEHTLRKSVLAEYVSENQQGLDILSRNLAQAANLVNSFKQVAVDQASDHRRSFDLAETVHHVIQTMQVLFDSHIELEPLVPDGLQFDSYPGALVQTLNNLIANAETHGFVGRERGKVTISAEMMTSNRVKLVVHDDGLGIDPEHLSHIFEPFFTTKLGQGGSGLGLSIVYNLVTSILGGQIDVVSEINHGTTFTIQLPLQAPIKVHPKDA